MSLSIFESTKNWSYSQNDELAETHVQKIIDSIRETLPTNFYQREALLHLEFLRGSKLFGLLKTLPKGALLNIYFNSSADIDFIRNCVAKESNIYLTSDRNYFRIGTKKQAEQENWASFGELSKQFSSNDTFVQNIVQKVIFSQKQLETVCEHPETTSNILRNKIININLLLESISIFRSYTKHLLRKYIKNGYQRIEIRMPIKQLKEFDQQGNLINVHNFKRFTEEIDKVFDEVKHQSNHFTLGVIFCAGKLPHAEVNTLFTNITELQWNKTIGFDFYDQFENFEELKEYDQILTKILQKEPNRGYKKLYHAGETNNHTLPTVEIAVKAGAVRIAKGMNILQRVEFLPYCKHVCFQKCLISNLIFGFKSDPRESSAPILLGLGYAVALSSGDAGKFGAIDSTQDYATAVISCNLSLKHLKLMAIHSINHAIVPQAVRVNIFQKFNENWNKWVGNLLKFEENHLLAKMSRQLNIFTNTKNWRYTQNDQKAELKFGALINKTMASLPENFYYIHTLTHLQFMRSTQLYSVLKTLPKGVLHHVHLDCCQDEQFYAEHIVTDPNVYMSADAKTFKIGPQKQAAEEGWIPFDKFRNKFSSEREFFRFITNITMLSKEQLLRISCDQKTLWDIFETKISSFFVLIFSAHIFKKYIKYVFLKYIKNGYERIQFRALLVKLKQFDSTGSLIKQHDEKLFMDLMDEAYQQVKLQHPTFTFGVIFFGLKMLSKEENFNLLDKMCSYQWKHTIGIDFVQQEDPYGSQKPYIAIGDQVLKKHSHLDYKKVYHAGETKDHLNDNVELAVRAGSVRIGHGLNIVKRIEFLSQCKHICFELNPISNLLTGSMKDIRLSTAPLLLGLGHAVSISPDDPGKFGYEDTTVDFFVSAVSFNWDFRHFKLIAYHAINHAICTEGLRLKMIDQFHAKWDAWVEKYLQE